MDPTTRQRYFVNHRTRTTTWAGTSAVQSCAAGESDRRSSLAHVVVFIERLQRGDRQTTPLLRLGITAPIERSFVAVIQCELFALHLGTIDVEEVRL